MPPAPARGCCAGGAGAVLRGVGVDVDGELCVVGGEGAHVVPPGSGRPAVPVVIWKVEVALGCKVKSLTLHGGARFIVGRCGSPSLPSPRGSRPRRCGTTNGSG